MYKPALRIDVGEGMNGWVIQDGMEGIKSGLWDGFYFWVFMEMMHPVILVRSNQERKDSGRVLSAHSFVLVVTPKLPNVMFILKEKTEGLKVLYFPFG